VWYGHERVAGRSYFAVEEAPEGGYVAGALGHRCHCDDADRPKLIRLNFVREEVIAA